MVDAVADGTGGSGRSSGEVLDDVNEDGHGEVEQRLCSSSSLPRKFFPPNQI